MNTSEVNFNRPVGNVNEREINNIVSTLNTILADEYALFTKTLNYHWNITGPRFHSLHTFLEDSYKDTLEVMDSVAERVRILGERPLSTVKKLGEEMSIEEKNGRDMSSSEMLADLFKSNMLIQNTIRTSLNEDELFKQDPGTEDFLVGLLQKHETMSWTLKSHLD